jgi:RES domain-containing protein
MEAFRLARARFAVPLSGKGASISGARWNSVGVELLYLASNRSLAMAEVSVHLTIATLPNDYVMLTIHIPDDISFFNLNVKDLPEDWNTFPHRPSTQWIGDNFVSEGKFCVLKIPSAVTKGDFNYLVNPRHPEFDRIVVIDQVDFPFDDRMFNK